MTNSKSNFVYRLAHLYCIRTCGVVATMSSDRCELCITQEIHHVLYYRIYKPSPSPRLRTIHTGVRCTNLHNKQNKVNYIKTVVFEIPRADCWLSP